MKFKKLTAALCAAVMAGSMFATTAFAGNVMFGDVDLNKSINVTDIVKAAAHVKSKKPLEGEELKAADVNQDGVVNITDVGLIAAHVKGKKAIVQPARAKK